MSFKIEKDIIPGLNQPALNDTLIVVAHESGNPNNTGRNSLENEIKYMKNNWNKGAKAYTSDWVGGGGRIVQLAEVGKRQNGAGYVANGITYAHVELARTDDPATFKKDYEAYVWLLRKRAKDAGLPLSFDTSNKKGIKSHEWVTKNLGGTTHVDPFAYLASHGISRAQFKKDVENGIGGKVGTSKPAASNPSKPKKKTVAQMAKEVIAGKHGEGHPARKKSLGISDAEYAKVRAEVNKRLGAPAHKNTTKSIKQMATEVIAGKHGTGHAKRQRSLGLGDETYAKVRAEVNKRAGKPTSKPKQSVSQMATRIINDSKAPTGHDARRKWLGIDNATYQKVRAEVNKRM